MSKTVEVYGIDELSIDSYDCDGYLAWLREHDKVDEALVLWADKLMDLFQYVEGIGDCLDEVMVELGWEEE